MSTHVFSNLLNKLTKRDKMQHWLTRLGELPLVFTGGIYHCFPAWQIRLKWQILANNGKYIFFAGKYWQIMANITFWTRNTGKFDF